MPRYQILLVILLAGRVFGDPAPKPYFIKQGGDKTYTLWKTVGNSAPEVVGYFDGWTEGVAAVDDDMAKNDEIDVKYHLKSDEERDDDAGTA